MTVEEPVHVIAYDPDWPAVFAAERQRLCAALAVSHDDIEHIGSTAVPGLNAKPIIDLMLGAADYPPHTEITSGIERLGYENLGEAGVPERIYFRCRLPRAFNLHVVRRGGQHWATNIALRQYLRAHAPARARYAEAKQHALACGHQTLLAYSDAKGSVVSELIARALRWSGES
jgi:GrpB-like predicted nucleotidyltransferase (UPF0157 family)